MSNVEPISPYFRASACSCSKTADWIDLTFGVVVTIVDANIVLGGQPNRRPKLRVHNG